VAKLQDVAVMGVFTHTATPVARRNLIDSSMYWGYHPISDSTDN
jgi:hypothetical protein